MMLGTYNRLRVHVAASDREVIRKARLKIAKHHRRSRSVRGVRHQFFREMLAAHHSAQDLCRAFRF